MIVLQLPVRFRALSLTSYKRERSQNYRPLARPRVIKLSLLWSSLSTGPGHVTHVISRTRASRFSACNIEKLGIGAVAWGRGYSARIF